MTKKNLQLIEKKENDKNDESGETGQGGKSGEIEFRYQDILSAPSRDDLLPPNEIKRLLTVHKEVHKARVDKQKQTRNTRQSLRENTQPSAYMRGDTKGYESRSQYKKHYLSDTAQFSGIDKQVIGITPQNEALTNSEEKEALEEKYQNKHRNVPKFNPRPRFPG